MKKSKVNPDQQSLFAVEPVRHEESDNSSKASSPAKKRKPKKALSFHRDNGLVLCPVYDNGEATWEELPEDDDRARTFIGLCYADPKFLKGAQWRYQAYLDALKVQGYKPPPLDYYAIWKRQQEEGMVELSLF